MNDKALTVSAPRLAMPVGAEARGISPELWRILTDAIFPNAREADKIVLAFEWCRHRQLDIMKRPVNIVPMWSSELGRMSEQLWPSIGEVEITASRTKEWAGMDEPKFGPDVTKTFEGRRKDKKSGRWEPHKIEVTYPEWCSVTVYRLVGGQRCAFTEPVWWTEAYARVGGTELPNDMWTKRPKGQLVKVAKAFSLRAAFPEEGDTTSEEMEGQTIDAPPPPPAPADNWTPPAQIAQTTAQTAQTAQTGEPDVNEELDRAGEGEDAPLDHDPETGEVGPRELELGDEEPWRDWCTRLLKEIREETALEEVAAWVKANAKNLEALTKEAPKIKASLEAAIGRHRQEITRQQQEHGDGSPVQPRH